MQQQVILYAIINSMDSIVLEETLIPNNTREQASTNLQLTIVAHTRSRTGSMLYMINYLGDNGHTLHIQVAFHFILSFVHHVSSQTLFLSYAKSGI